MPTPFWFTTQLLFAMTQWPTNAVHLDRLKALYNMAHSLGVPDLFIYQRALFLLGRNGFMTAAYWVPASTQVLFYLSAATFFVLA